MGTQPESLTVSVKEAARLLGVSHTTLYEAIKSGGFPHIKIGQRIRIPKAAIEQLVGASV